VAAVDNVLDVLAGDFCPVGDFDHEDIGLAAAYGRNSAHLWILDIHHHLVDHQVGHTNNRVYAGNDISVLIRRVPHPDNDPGHIETLGQYRTGEIIRIASGRRHDDVGLSYAGLVQCLNARSSSGNRNDPGLGIQLVADLLMLLD